MANIKILYSNQTECFENTSLRFYEPQLFKNELALEKVDENYGVSFFLKNSGKFVERLRDKNDPTLTYRFEKKLKSRRTEPFKENDKTKCLCFAGNKKVKKENFDPKFAGTANWSLKNCIKMKKICPGQDIASNKSCDRGKTLLQLMQFDEEINWNLTPESPRFGCDNGHINIEQNESSPTFLSLSFGWEDDNFSSAWLKEEETCREKFEISFGQNTSKT